MSSERGKAAEDVPTGSVAICIAAASFGFVVTQLDVTIVNVALPSIADAISASMSALQWVVDGYTLGFAALLLSGGVLSDRFGARRVYLIGLVSFAVASAACGLAPSAEWLVAARVIQGICATILVPPSLALINHRCGHDLRLRARAVAIWTAAGGVSIAAGPVLGGLLSSAISWRAIFLVNLPLCLIGVLLAKACDETDRSETRRFDWAGQGLAITSMAMLLAGIIGIGGHGLSGSSVALCLAAVAGGGAFLVVEAKTAQPMLPLSLLRAEGFLPATAFGVGTNLAYYGIVFVLSLYLQRVLGYSPNRTGLVFLPLTGTFILSNLFSGYAMARWGCRSPMVAGGMIAACGYALLLDLGADSSWVSMMVPFFLIPGGMGLAVPAMTTIILSSVPKASSGTASGVLNAARQAGGAVGVAVYGALANTAGGLVHGLHDTAAISATLMVSVAVMAWFGLSHARSA